MRMVEGGRRQLIGLVVWVLLFSRCTPLLQCLRLALQTHV